MAFILAVIIGCIAAHVFKSDVSGFFVFLLAWIVLESD